jgi:hypothetical protein
MATMSTVIRTPDHTSTFKGDFVVKSVTERPSAPKRSRKDMKSLALVCRQFWRLVTHFQFEEIEVAKISAAFPSSTPSLAIGLSKAKSPGKREELRKYTVCFEINLIYA